MEVVELGTENQEGYTRRHLKIRSESDDWIPAYLLVPKQPAATRVPAMLCLHQTVAQGKDEPCGIRGDPELAFAVELVRRSYVCLAPDVIGFGERIPAGQQPYHDSIAFYRKHPGWAFLGKMIWDIGRLVDYLETLPEVDPQRIGSIGHSHGAYGTLFAAAFEPRVSVAIASCGFTTFRADPNPERWSHATALLPQLGSYLPNTASIPFDWQHVLGLVAPRPLFIWYATRDAIFSKTDNLDGLLKDVQGVYRLYERPDALAWQAFFREPSISEDSTAGCLSLAGSNLVAEPQTRAACRSQCARLDHASLPGIGRRLGASSGFESGQRLLPGGIGQPCTRQRPDASLGRGDPRLAHSRG